MERIEVGDIVKHFKRGMSSEGQKLQNFYVYQVMDIAEHTETKEKMVYYRELYGECKSHVRPYDMFMEEVDHEKYPRAKQRYRFEPILKGLTPINMPIVSRGWNYNISFYDLIQFANYAYIVEGVHPEMYLPTDESNKKFLVLINRFESKIAGIYYLYGVQYTDDTVIINQENTTKLSVSDAVRIMQNDLISTFLRVDSESIGMRKRLGGF